MSKHKDLARVVTAIESIGTTPTRRDTSRPPKEARAPFLYRIQTALLVNEKKSARAVFARRSFPIMAYVGPNGGGKSLAMVHDTLPSLRAGRTVLSTVRLLDHRTGQPHAAYVPFTNWDQLLEARDCDVLMDEMVGIAGARESQKLDVRIQNILVQLRRRNVVLRWSAPNWARADKIVREVTQSVTECRGFYSDRSLVRAGDDNAVQLWAPKRLFNFRTFDTLDFEEWSAGKREKLAPSVREWFKGAGSVAFKSYDTMDAVERVISAESDGTCSVCGKKMRLEYCKGSHTEESLSPLSVEFLQSSADGSPDDGVRDPQHERGHADGYGQADYEHDHSHGEAFSEDLIDGHIRNVAASPAWHSPQSRALADGVGRRT